MKTIADITKEIAKREAKKSQVTIGNIREIVGILSDLIYEQKIVLKRDEKYICGLLRKNGLARAKKAKKK